MQNERKNIFLNSVQQRIYLIIVTKKNSIFLPVKRSPANQSVLSQNILLLALRSLGKLFLDPT